MQSYIEYVAKVRHLQFLIQIYFMNQPKNTCDLKFITMSIASYSFFIADTSIYKMK